MTQQFVHTFTHQDQSIGVMANGQFFVAMTERVYDTYREATEAVDNKLKQLEKVSRRKLNLPVIAANGVSSAITGVHSTRGVLLFSPAIKDNRFGCAPAVYPQHPKVSKLVSERLTLRQRIDAIDTALRPLEIKDGYHYSNMALDERYELTESQHANALKAADGLPEAQ